MRYSVIDTETSGLFDYSKPADAEGQPRLAQLALCFLAPDFSIEREESFLIRPEGWIFDDACEAAAKNGLTHARLEAEGGRIEHALGAYNRAIDEGHIFVGFNVAFDLKIMRGELRRAGLGDRFTETLPIDCMRPMANVIKAATGAKYKVPKLTEAHAFVAGEELAGAHDALIDARSCAGIFRHLVEGAVFTADQLAGIKESK